MTGKSKIFILTADKYVEASGYTCCYHSGSCNDQT